MGRECFDEDECLLRLGIHGLNLTSDDMTKDRFENLCNRTHGCSQNCVNTIGSFVCVCFKGFEKDLNNPDTCSGK